MKHRISHARIRLILGAVSLGIGLLTANMALFQWAEQISLLGAYARYVCAYGGFGAMIFGALLVNDFFVRMSTPKRESVRARPPARSSKSRTIRADVRVAEEQVVTVNTRRNQKRSQ